MGSGAVLVEVDAPVGEFAELSLLLEFYRAQKSVIRLHYGWFAIRRQSRCARKPLPLPTDFDVPAASSAL